MLTEKLGLTQDQQDKVKAIQEKNAPQFKDLLAKGRENLSEDDKTKLARADEDPDGRNRRDPHARAKGKNEGPAPRRPRRRAPQARGCREVSTGPN